MHTDEAATRLALIRHLSDGLDHSVRALADSLGADEATIATLADSLAGYGLAASLKNGCYRLSRSLELLDRQRITDNLRVSLPIRLQVIGETDSTNALARDSMPPPGEAVACLAEFQHQGRGRLGRSWLAPFASGLCLSVGWPCARKPAALSGLSLAVGVAARELLTAAGVAGVRLKWPNDLLLGEGKLGGVLIELSNAGSGRTHVVVGIGINVCLSEAARQAVRDSGGAAACVADALSTASRNELAASLINGVIAALHRYDADGLDAFRVQWQHADALRDQPVRVFAGATAIDGVARGIDRTGALALDTADGRQYIAGGEVSLRRKSDVAD